MAELANRAATWAVPWRCTAEFYPVAAIWVDHEVSKLTTRDRDFSRFPGVRTRRLLA